MQPENTAGPMHRYLLRVPVGSNQTRNRLGRIHFGWPGFDCSDPGSRRFSSAVGAFAISASHKHRRSCSLNICFMNVVHFHDVFDSIWFHFVLGSIRAVPGTPFFPFGTARFETLNGAFELLKKERKKSEDFAARA